MVLLIPARTEETMAELVKLHEVEKSWGIFPLLPPPVLPFSSAQSTRGASRVQEWY